MKRQDAIKRIKRIIDDMAGGVLSDSLTEHLAERIYIDVMAPAVDEECSKWIGFGFAHHDGRNLH